MEKKVNILNRSRIERMKFYAEIGNYFSPEGRLDENSFRLKLNEAIEKKRVEEEENGHDFRLSEWMSVYLAEIIDYLLNKGLPGEAFALIKTAAEEAEKHGVTDLTIPAAQIKLLMERVPSPPKREERKKNTSEEMQKKIYDAAITLFGEKGYHRTTIDDIVALSGVGKGSFYRYFKSKDELLSKLVKEKFKKISLAMNRILSEETGVMNQITEMVSTWLQFIESNHVVYRLIQLEGVNSEMSTPLMFYDYIIKHLPMIKERIIALDKKRELKITDFNTLFYGLLGFIEGVAHKWYHNNMSYPLKDELPVITDLIFNGLAVKNVNADEGSN